jgi:hypothetical protein
MKYEQGSPGAFGFAAGGPQFAVAGFAGTSSLRDQSIAAGFDYSITPTWLSNFRFGFFRYGVFVNPNGVGTPPAKDAGIPGLNLDPYYASGMPAFTLNVTGGFNFGLPINQGHLVPSPYVIEARASEDKAAVAPSTKSGTHSGDMLKATYSRERWSTPSGW